ncbi:DUF4199 domain-containing protein [Fibrella aquatica]|uniref:DUF4199 domain-containing protein n=1 Tax=Fibrella aquatica TaxID=3242487 RepID=UPI003521960B
MQKTILVFGSIAGFIASTTLVVMMLIHKQNPSTFDSGELVGYASMILWGSLIPVAIKSYRDRYQGGAISFKDAFLMGLGIALIASALYVITWVIFYKTVYPNFVTDFTKCTIDKLRADGKSPAEIADSMQQMRSMFSYYDTWLGLIGITFVEVFPIGFLFALVSASVLKRKGTIVVQ